MFLILPCLLISGLLSILTVLISFSLYGTGLIILGHMIRNVRQETSRAMLGQFLWWVALDHLLSAAVAGLMIGLLVGNTSLNQSFLTLLQSGDGSADMTMLVTVLSMVAFLIVVWVMVGVGLIWLQPDLAPHLPIHRQLRWNTATIVAIVLGVLLNLSTVFVFLILAAPLLWHMERTTRMSRQSSLVWTLAIAARKGLPMGQEVAALADGFWGRHRLRLQLLSENLDSGLSLASSLERQPGLVPRSAVMQIRMGEDSQLISASLESCALSYARLRDREIDLISAQQAFLLLLIPLLMIPNIVAFLGYYILPKFKKIFEDFGTELPAITMQMIDVIEPSSGVFFLFMMGSGACLVLALVVNLRDWEQDWPLLNMLAPRVNSPPILRSLALLIREQRPLTDGIQGLIWSHPRRTVRHRLERIQENLLNGGDLALALHEERLIRRGDVALLHAAQRVRNLPWCLTQLAESMEQRFWYRIRTMLEAGFPVAVIVLGLIVLLIVTGFFMPLVKLLNDLS